MISIVVKILTSEGNLSFYFNQLTSNYTLVSTVGRRNKTYLFYMQKAKGGWEKLESSNKCLFWTSSLEQIIIKILEDEIDGLPNCNAA